jgi:flagellar hook-associated protein 3 FlgL
MGSVVGIPSTRVSDLFIRQRVVSQMLSDQLDLFRIQTQLSTGHRIQMPSEDPGAALRIISLQRLLERKEQVQTNLRTNQSYLTATDTALSTVSSLLAEARGVALGAVGTTVTDAQREAAAQQIQSTLGQLVDVGNQKFRDRYLFAGAGTATRPFEITGSNLVRYLGDEGKLSSYSDIDALFYTNYHGSEVFGAISQPVLGTADLNPILTSNTRLADLRAGQGITRGSLAISDGSTTSIIDLSSAKTIGDVAALIGAGAGAITLSVAVTPTGLRIDGTPAAPLTIREVAGGTTARELGIYTTTPTDTIVGSDLDPILRLTTPLADILGGAFDKQSGLQILNGGETHVLSFADAETVEDVLNTLNASDAGVLAEINQDATGINVRSRLSGADFAIGENGGTTATQLGLRTFTTQTRLDDLNFGRGVEDCPGTDFTITRSDGGAIDVDVSGLETIGEVLDQINTLSGGTLQARLAAYGNGIELVDQTSGSGTLTVSRVFPSTAATGLGLIPQGQESSSASSPGATATAAMVSAGPNNDLIFSSLAAGTELNGVTVVFQDTGVEAVNYDPVARTLTFDIIALLAGDPAAGALFTASLDPADGAPNDGTGFVQDGLTASLSGGSQILTGSDVNPLETEGVFTALSRLYAALKANDVLEVQRAIDLLDRETVNFNFTRAELGAQQQGLENVGQRLESENVDLQAALSQDLDSDIAETISNLTARQTAFEAAMKSTAAIFQMTLLDYL